MSKETFISKSDRAAFIVILADQLIAADDWSGSYIDATELAKRFMDIVDPPVTRVLES